MSDFARDAERSRQRKVALRNQLITARRSLSASDRRAADASIQAFTVARVRAARPTVCAAYAPLGTEPGGADLPERLADALPGRQVLLPVLLPDGDLDWAPLDQTRHDGGLHRGSRGLLEPTSPRLGPDAITRADLIIVPALAVDRRTGVRMGRGGGSYDRALSRLSFPSSRTSVIALLHDGELLDDLPQEPHDRPVDAVVTPSGGFAPLPSGGSPAGRNKLR
jgi:5-formyltetrahydrofolate cyclo-ligase